MRCGNHRWFWISFACVLGVTPACDNELPTPRIGLTPVQTVNITVTGVVRDETGSPFANALVGVQSYSFYDDGLIWQTVRADSSGRYELVAGIWNGPGSWLLGRASVDGDEFEPMFQIVPLTANAGARDFRVRRVRHGTSDETVTVSFDAESGLCVDEDRPFSTENRCETARITAMRGGLLTVAVRPAEAGGAIPFVALNGLQSSLAGRASAFVQAGQTYRVRVQVPAGTPPGNYIVSPSIE